MFPDSILEVASARDVFRRGAMLFRDGHVQRCEVETIEEHSPYVTVDGTVRGSQIASYNVRVTLDLDEQEVVSYGCTCPAHMTYGGMCKHSVALALCYLARLGALDLPSQEAARRVPQAFTSPQIERLMTAYAAQAIAGARKASPREGEGRQADPVQLMCIIAKGGDAYRTYLDDGMWRLGLKISRGKASYIVKNIDELVDAWREERLHRYGKNLEFVHRRSASGGCALWARRVSQAYWPTIWAWARPCR